MSFFNMPRSFLFGQSFRDGTIVFFAVVLLAAPVHLQLMNASDAVASTKVFVPSPSTSEHSFERVKKLIYSDEMIDAARQQAARLARNEAPSVLQFIDQNIEEVTGISVLTQWNMVSARLFRHSLDVTIVDSTLLNFSYRSADAHAAQNASRIMADLYASAFMPVASIASGTRQNGTVAASVSATRIDLKPVQNSLSPRLFIAATLGGMAGFALIMMMRYVRDLAPKHLLDQKRR